jgi:hypothetical protein
MEAGAREETLLRDQIVGAEEVMRAEAALLRKTGL